MSPLGRSHFLRRRQPESLVESSSPGGSSAALPALADNAEDPAEKAMTEEVKVLAASLYSIRFSTMKFNFFVIKNRGVHSANIPTSVAVNAHRILSVESPRRPAEANTRPHSNVKLASTFDADRTFLDLLSEIHADLLREISQSATPAQPNDADRRRRPGLRLIPSRARMRRSDTEQQQQHVSQSETTPVTSPVRSTYRSAPSHPELLSSPVHSSGLSPTAPRSLPPAEDQTETSDVIQLTGLIQLVKDAACTHILNEEPHYAAASIEVYVACHSNSIGFVAVVTAVIDRGQALKRWSSTCKSNRAKALEEVLHWFEHNWNGPPS